MIVILYELGNLPICSPRSYGFVISSCILAIVVATAGVDLKTASEYWTQSTNMSSLDPRGELIRNKATEEAKT